MTAAMVMWEIRSASRNHTGQILHYVVLMLFVRTSASATA